MRWQEVTGAEGLCLHLIRGAGAAAEQARGVFLVTIHLEQIKDSFSFPAEEISRGWQVLRRALNFLYGAVRGAGAAAE